MISLGLAFFSAFFTSALITSTLIGSKLVSIFGFTLSVGLFIFPFTFITNEIVTEAYGKRASRFLVTNGIFIQLFVLAFVWLGGMLPASPIRNLEREYQAIFLLTPRMVLASITAYSLSQFIDIETFLKVKAMTDGKYLWLRANLASLFSQAIDTLIFSFIFLGGILPLNLLLMGALVAYCVKIGLGFFDTPFVYLGVRAAKYFDREQKSALIAIPIRTEIFKSGDDLFQFITHSIPREMIQENAVIALTSKLMSIAENAWVPKKTIDGSPEYRIEKTALVKQEADQYLGETLFGVSLTVKHGILIPTAGIDESNSEHAHYLLFPKNPYDSSRALWARLREHYGVKNLGFILTDSHTTPLRKGVTGIGLAHAGFKATRDLVGAPDLFGRIMKMTHVNVLDALATTAVYKMGETNDSAPLAVLYSNDVEFTESFSINDIKIPLEEDLYGNFFK